MNDSAMAGMWLTIMALLALVKFSESVVCHDQCIGVIGCSKIVDVCEGKYCTFYRHRDLQKSPERITLKRSCSDTPFFSYGPDKQQFGVRNRCIKTISGNNEWMLQVCDTADYCNSDCNSNLRLASSVTRISAMSIALVLPALFLM
ncbi:unnamed protein product [Bursaphelenchus xylophilus]|uniref:(pine wood nematode) hypothetical protein n=1 Tax=Bursaphelenchus xylophilus TaxID=6326 RepID=A0A1I7RIR2_BURXY|nr:unnamed protein product [Bursaphelenchus xylophilus]CAG9119033.1 unnamed protein product [Bursaphelenchus xylophilus]